MRPHNKNNYLWHSQYLSRITENSIEESLITQSFDYRMSKVDDDKSKHMLISKYSYTDDGGRDSVAFLYDKLKDKLDNDSSDCNSDRNQQDQSLERDYNYNYSDNCSIYEDKNSNNNIKSFTKELLNENEVDQIK